MLSSSDLLDTGSWARREGGGPSSHLRSSSVPASPLPFQLRAWVVTTRLHPASGWQPPPTPQAALAFQKLLVVAQLSPRRALVSAVNVLDVTTRKPESMTILPDAVLSVLMKKSLNQSVIFLKFDNHD